MDEKQDKKLLDNGVSHHEGRPGEKISENGTSLHEPVKSMLSVDELLEYVGEFGKFQRILEVMFCCCIFGVTYPILIMYFAALNPEWKCAANSTFCRANGTFKSLNTSRCHMPRTAWQYDAPKDFSIVTQYELQCERNWLVYMTTTTIFLGWALGAIVLGWVADNYGRRTVLFPSLGSLFLLGFISTFLPNIESFIVFRFMIGFVIPGTSVQMFIMISELVGGRYRPFAGMMLWFFWTVSLCILGLKAYYIRSWKTLFMITTLPYMFVLLFFKFVPESIRWLNIKGRTKEAMAILSRAAKMNGKSIPESITLMAHKKEVLDRKTSPIDLFRSCKIASRTLIQGFTWFTSGLVYYGLSLAADEFGGSIYVNYVLASMVEFPAVIIAILACNYIGRKKTIIGSMMTGSISCFAVAFIPKKMFWKYIRQTIGIIGKFAITLAFDSLYTWSVEIYPTVLRSQAMGFLQVTSRLGAASSPWVAKGFQTFHPKAPFIAMASMGMISGITMFWLPETKGKETAETVEDTEDTGATSQELEELAGRVVVEENGNLNNYNEKA